MVFSQNVYSKQRITNRTYGSQHWIPRIIKLPIYVPVDTQKAFDVVDHSSLLRRLYLDGIEGDDWLLVRAIYSDCSSRIKWAGGVSHPIYLSSCTPKPPRRT